MIGAAQMKNWTVEVVQPFTQQHMQAPESHPSHARACLRLVDVLEASLRERTLDVLNDEAGYKDDRVAHLRRQYDNAIVAAAAARYCPPKPVTLPLSGRIYRVREC